MSLASQHSQLIRQEAKRLGFDYVGFSKAAFLEEEAPRLESWLNKDMHGKMSYMENYFDKRLDPTLLVPGAKSVVSLLLNYYPSGQQRKDAPQISKYAYGKDYHEVIKEKLVQLLEFIRNEIGEVAGRSFVDSAPVLDKAWAKKSGLGWIGKNSNLINKNSGSFYFIAELIIDLELEYDNAIKDYCGTCTRCIDACPTNAIVAPYVVDGSKCISYFTIELKENIPDEFKGKFDNWAFGCDTCQDVCPWNRFSSPHQQPAFTANQAVLQFTEKEWTELTKETFKQVFRESPLRRTKYSGITRNIKFLRES